MSNRKRVPFLLALACFEFINVSRTPRFTSIHAVDVVQLLVCGMCVGLALAALGCGRRAAAQDNASVR